MATIKAKRVKKGADPEDGYVVKASIGGVEVEFDIVQVLREGEHLVCIVVESQNSFWRGLFMPPAYYFCHLCNRVVGDDLDDDYDYCPKCGRNDFSQYRLDKATLGELMNFEDWYYLEDYQDRLETVSPMVSAKGAA